MSLITVREIHKSYDPKRQLLAGVSMVVQKGDRIGLVGPNGCGKSTLLRILAGLETADEGERAIRTDLRVGYLQQEPDLPPSVSIRDAVSQGLAARAEILRELEDVHRALSAAQPDETAESSDWERLLNRQAALEDRLQLMGGHDIEHEVDRHLEALGVRNLETLCGQLSGGEKRRVALARLLLEGPDVLLLDEPTNHLDAQASEWLEDWLLRCSQPLILVTHDRYFLDRVVDRILEIDQGRIFEYEGQYHEFLLQRAARLEAQRKTEQSRLLLLRRETEWMRRGPPARSTKAKARKRRYEELASAKPQSLPEFEFRFPPIPRLGNRVLSLDGVTMGIGRRTLWEKVELELGQRARLGIVGPNGAGKTTFLKVCMEELSPDSGEVQVGPTVRFAYIDQTRADLDPEKTVAQEVATEGGVVKVGERRVHIEGFLDRFLFPGDRKHVPIRTLSGGEKNRVLLAKLLCAEGNVLLLDEPTNDLDLGSLRILEEALMAFEGAVIVVSHDRYFLDRIATDILYLDGRGGARRHPGDVSSLLEELAGAKESAAPNKETARPVSVAGKPAKAKSPRARKLKWKEERELEALPEQIAGLEAELEELDRQLADPELYTRSDRDPAGVTARREALVGELEQCYERWQELESIAEAS